MATERVTWIDICRGIGILLVIYGHALAGDRNTYLIYSFHMPLFFFLSGLVYNRDKHTAFFPYVKKTMRNTLGPFFLFAFLSLLLWILFPEYPIPKGMIRNQFLGTFYANSAFWNTHYGILSYNNILWFLPCLFVVKIVFAGLTQYSTRIRFLVPALLLSSILGYLYTLFFPTFFLPFASEIALPALVYYGAGFLWRAHMGIEVIFATKGKSWVVFILSTVLLIFLATLHYTFNHHKIDLRLHSQGNYFLFYLTAAIGIVSSISLSHLLATNTLLRYLGRQSLILFAWHLIFFGYLTRLLKHVISVQLIFAWHNTYLAPIYTIVSILVILTIAKLIQTLRTKMITER